MAKIIAAPSSADTEFADQKNAAGIGVMSGYRIVEERMAYRGNLNPVLNGGRSRVCVLTAVVTVSRLYGWLDNR